MSKKVRTILLAGCILFMTGCGKSEKVLNCTQDLEELSPSSHLEYELHFSEKGKTLESYTYKEGRNYSEEITDEEYQFVSSVCELYKDMKGVECDFSKEGKKLTSVLKVTLSDLDKDGKNILGLKGDQDSSYDDFKKTLEASGFSCK